MNREETSRSVAEELYPTNQFYSDKINEEFSRKQVAFVEGAKWADNHPSDETIKKICLLDEAWDDAGGLSGTKLGFIDYIKKHWEEMKNDK